MRPNARVYVWVDIPSVHWVGTIESSDLLPVLWPWLNSHGLISGPSQWSWGRHIHAYSKHFKRISRKHPEIIVGLVSFCFIFVSFFSFCTRIKCVRSKRREPSRVSFHLIWRMCLCLELLAYSFSYLASSWNFQIFYPADCCTVINL